MTTSFHIGPTIEVGELTLTVVEMTSVDHREMGRGILLQVRKEPYAVLVRKEDATYAIGMDGAIMSDIDLVRVSFR